MTVKELNDILMKVKLLIMTFIFIFHITI